MKKFITSIALFISMTFAIQVSAETSVPIDGIVYEAYSATNAWIKSSSQEIEIADILSKVNIDGQEYVVDCIADRAFFNCKMTSVTIPSTIHSIGEKAFYGCKGLTTLDIPSSVTYIGENAFEKCTSIERLSISTSLPEITEGTFYECYSLSSVTVPPSVKTIGKAAFYSCYSMQSLSLPSTLESIGEWAFYGCDHLLSLTIPSSVKEIGESAFWNCTSLKSATISSSATEIPRGMFYGCHELTDIVIPSSITSIGERAFEQCLLLPVVVLPSYVTTIKESAFKNCEKLFTIVSLPAVPPTIEANAFYRVPEDAVVYASAESLGEYPAAEGWKTFHDFRALGSIELTISSTQINLKLEETAILTVNVEKAYDVTIESETWWTNNPEVAVVDNGKVMAVGEGNATICFTVIDGTGCPHTISFDVFVYGHTGIDVVDAEVSPDEPIEYYNLNGMRVNVETLAPGLYIKKQGNHSVKVLRN